MPLYAYLCRVKIHLICIGKTDDRYIAEGIEKFQNRLKHYVSFKMTVIPDVKNTKSLSVEQQKAKEAVLIEKQLQPQDFLILLDEKGSDFTSVGFANFLEKQSLASVQQLTFVIGGAYGFDASVYNRSNKRISLSKMTFSHQMVRLFFVEQLYRAYTIQRGEPYHHE